METCTSCHTGIDFKAGQGHSQQNDNSNCVACHNASWTEEIHLGGFNSTKALIDTYGINTTSTIDAASQAATISIQVVDSSGAEVDINSILPMVQRFEIITNVGETTSPLVTMVKILSTQLKTALSTPLMALQLKMESWFTPLLKTLNLTQKLVLITKQHSPS